MKNKMKQDNTCDKKLETPDEGLQDFIKRNDIQINALKKLLNELEQKEQLSKNQSTK